jgi:septum formation protein
MTDGLDGTREDRPEVYHRFVRLLLASASPRRRELLAAAGLAFDVEAVDVDERREPGEPPATYVDRVARLKASAAAARYPARPVIGADTAVVVDGDVLGKPSDAGDAARMLRRLAGRSHDVLTGVALAWQGRMTSEVTVTRVRMDPLTAAEVADYVASGEPHDKAGGYAIQGLASRFIPHIEGSFSNVVGLPVAAVLQLLRRAGVPDIGVS